MKLFIHHAHDPSIFFSVKQSTYVKNCFEQNSQPHPCIPQHSCGNKTVKSGILRSGLWTDALSLILNEENQPGTVGTKIIF